jgi:chromosomal replication initiation ATPase DnaA
MKYYNPNEIIKACLEYYELDFKTGSRTQDHVEARRMTMALLSEMTTLSVTRIANMVGMKRSSVTKSTGLISDQITYDQRILNDFNEIKSKLI